MDQQLAGRPWLRLCRKSRPDALERTEIHRGDGRSYYRECMGTGVLRDEDRQQAMVVWASCVPSQHFALGIEDEKNNHRLYYSVTKDFKTWTKGKLLIDPGFSCIDATLLKRGKNDYVMVLKDNTRNARNIKGGFCQEPDGDRGARLQNHSPVISWKDQPPSNCLRTVRWAMVFIYYDRYRLFDFGAHFTKDFVHFTDVSQR